MTTISYRKPQESTRANEITLETNRNTGNLKEAPGTTWIHIEPLEIHYKTWEHRNRDQIYDEIGTDQLGNHGD